MGKPATTDTREIIVEILLDLEKGQDFSTDFVVFDIETTWIPEIRHLSRELQRVP